jgi:glycosyltransferase involved in cell wall biosynthesis
VKQIHQLISSAAPGDAVTGQAFAWQGLLRSWGYESDIVAEHVYPGFEPYVRSLDREARSIRSADAVVLHYSIWGRVCESALSAEGKLVLCYHNVTPPEILRPFNRKIAHLCERGIKLLPRFANHYSLAVAYSTYNAEGLQQAGIENTVVVPLLLSLKDRPKEPSHLRTAPIVLFVGRIAPNKRLEDVIQIFARYQQRWESEATLALVGSPVEFDSYQLVLEQLVERLGVERVVFTGLISTHEREDWYRKASVYISMSVHEGFCAPLLEAMAKGVPVVARAAGAVPETLGGAGLLVDGEDFEQIAASLYEAASNMSTRSALAVKAERRLAEVRPEIVARRLRDALEPVLR